MSDSQRTIIGSAARFFSGTMFSRVTGMLRDMALAYAFGTQSAVAALLVAFRFAHLLRRLLGEGAMQTALIPHFEELRRDSAKNAGQFFCDLVASLTCAIAALTAVTMTFLGILLWSDLLSPGNQEIVWLTFIMMPSLLFICLFGVNASLLQCEKSYFLPSAAPAFFNLFWILGVICTASLPSYSAMSGMALFIIIACIAQWAATLPKTYALLHSYGIKRLWQDSTLFSREVRRLAKPLSLGIIGVGASQINNALDAVFARWADSEGPALLWFAIRIQQLPLALFGIAISGALLPPLTRAIKNNQLDLYRHFLSFATHKTLLLMIPISAFLFLMGDHCVAFIYGRGDFTSASIIGTTESLWGYTIGLVPMALVLILAPAFYARSNYRTPTQASVGAMGINIGLSALFVAWFGWGAAAIALATSISAWFNLAWLGLAASKEDSATGLSTMIDKSMLKILAATGMGAIVTSAVNYMVWGQVTAFELLQGIPVQYSLSMKHETLHLIVGTLAFSVGFVLLYLTKLFSLKRRKEKILP